MGTKRWCLGLGAVGAIVASSATHEAYAQQLAGWKGAVVDNGAALPPATAIAAPIAWYKFDGDFKDAMGKAKPFAEERPRFSPAITFGPDRTNASPRAVVWTRPVDSGKPHSPRLAIDDAAYFTRATFTWAMAFRSDNWSVTRWHSMSGQLCVVNNLLSVRGVLTVWVNGCGVKATNGYLFVEQSGRDGDFARIGGLNDATGIRVPGGQWNDLLISYDWRTKKLDVWLNRALVGSASVSPPRDVSSTASVYVGPFIEGAVEDLRLIPQKLTPNDFQGIQRTQ